LITREGEDGAPDELDDLAWLLLPAAGEK